MRNLAILLGLTAIAAEPAHHWSYSGKTGPTHWAELDEHFKACRTGKSQSPVDIRIGSAHGATLPPLTFHYEPNALHIVDNGHTVQVNVDPGSSLRVGGQRYELVQFHFHHPSEERINGKGADMVAHLVHRDAKGQLAVVAVLLRPGSENAMVESLWRNLPREKEREASPAGIRINPAGLIPPDHGYFTFTGSLTTPPCTEGVRWIVLRTPQALSKAEIAAFATRYPDNARPIQQLNGRKILATK
jgi:carbonic anhydrase